MDEEGNAILRKEGDEEDIMLLDDDLMENKEFDKLTNAEKAIVSPNL